MPTIRSQHPPFKDYFWSGGGHSQETEILLNDSGIIFALEEEIMLNNLQDYLSTRSSWVPLVL